MSSDGPFGAHVNEDGPVSFRGWVLLARVLRDAATAHPLSIVVEAVAHIRMLVTRTADMCAP
jgi:hypothetical protein